MQKIFHIKTCYEKVNASSWYLALCYTLCFGKNSHLYCAVADGLNTHLHAELKKGNELTQSFMHFMNFLLAQIPITTK